jgi:hypothetical protein
VCLAKLRLQFRNGIGNLLRGYEAQALPVLQRAHPAQRPLYPLRVVPLDVGVDPSRELVQGDAFPVPAVKHLRLHRPEEALHPRVVRRAALARHRASDARLVAYGDPLRPAVVAAAVAVDDEVGPLAGPGKPDGSLQHRVGHLCLVKPDFRFGGGTGNPYQTMTFGGRRVLT